MRNKIERAEIGSNNPFDLLRGQEEVEESLNLDEHGAEHSKTEAGFVEEEEEKDLITPTPHLNEDAEDAEDAEEEEEEEEEDDVAQVQIKTNIAKLMAERLKADGQLPKDFEVSENMSASDVENAYRDFMHDRVSQEEETNAYDKLKKEYGDESVLATARKLHYGVSEGEIQLVQVYETLGSIVIDDAEESFEDLTKTLYKQYYIDKGLTEEEADLNSERDFDDGDVDSLTVSRKNYFSNKAIELDNAQKESVKEAKRADTVRHEESEGRIKTMLEGRVLDDVTYSKKDMDIVNKALFEKSETIVLDDNSRVRVTPYYKKKYERAKNEEQSLKDIVDFILGYDTKTIKNKASRSSRKKIVDDLNDLIQVEVVTSRGIKKTQSTSKDAIQRREL